MTEPNQPALPADHAAHDATWIAALASRDPDLSPPERTRAEAALESCGDCADLFADLVAVSAAIPLAAIPARPREYTLTAADAARLRPRGIRRWLSAIGSARDGVTFPLAMGLTTMGIAGLLVATIPAALSGMSGATAGAAPQVLSTVGNAVPAPAASAAPAAPSSDAAAPAAASPASTAYDDLYGLSAAPTTETTGEGAFTGDDGDPATDGAQRQDAADMARDAAIRDDATGLSTLMIVAATLLVVGLGLFALRWSARRLGDG